MRAAAENILCPKFSPDCAHELHALLRQERFEEEQLVGRGAGDRDWTKLQSARLLARVPHEGGLEGGGAL
jgi:hypothetical protein